MSPALISLISDPLSIAVIVLGTMCIALLVLTIVLHIRLKRFLIGTNSKDLDDSLAFVSSNIKDLQSFRMEMEKYLIGVEKRLRTGVRSVETVRFNPFKGTGGGGNQSFATALLNEEGDGVIISSLYARDHVSVFSKPVKKHSSEYELSEEEREAMEKAKDKLEK